VTQLIDLAADVAAGGGWTIGARWRQGWTRAAPGITAIAAGRLTSDAFAVDASGRGVFLRGDRLGLRIAQPLRVSSGSYRLSLPVAYDYASGGVGYAERRLDLAPDGRERDVELAYGRKFGPGWIDTNLYVRREPGNIAAAPADLGAALRLTMAF
jgi:hypothetical protein